MYVDSSDLNSPVAMETDVPLIEDVQRLKETVEEGATQVNLTFSVSVIFPLYNITLDIDRSVIDPNSKSICTTIVIILYCV